MPMLAQVTGDSDQYQVHPQIKVYALQDIGFTKSSQGNFSWEQPLSASSPYQAAYVLKVKIKQDLKTLNLAVTDSSGLQKINIFKLQNNEELLEQYHYALDNLIQRQIIQKVNKS